MTRKPIHVTFRHLPPSDELTEMVEREAEHLMERRPPITFIRAAIELPHRSHRKGTLFRVCLELGVPGRALVVRARHEDPRAATHDAFEKAECSLHSYRGRRQRWRHRVRLPRVTQPRSA